MNHSTRIRFMRLVLFFDLPMETPAQRKSYSRFRKLIISEGFIMLQKSVYSKLAINDQDSAHVIKRIKRNKPAGGLVQILKVTEKQFANMEYITGEYSRNAILDDLNEIVIL